MKFTGKAEPRCSNQSVSTCGTTPGDVVVTKLYAEHAGALQSSAASQNNQAPEGHSGKDSEISRRREERVDGFDPENENDAGSRPKQRASRTRVLWMSLSPTPTPPATNRDFSGGVLMGAAMRPTVEFRSSVKTALAATSVGGAVHIVNRPSTGETLWPMLCAVAQGGNPAR